MNTNQIKLWDHYYKEILDSFHIPDMTLYEMLEGSVERFADQQAIMYEDHSISYQELKEKIDKLAAMWLIKGYQKGERIGIMVANHPDFVVAYYAAHSIGVTVVQINPAYTPRELLQILDDARVSYLVVDHNSIEIIRDVLEIYPFKHVTFTTSVLDKREDPDSMTEIFRNSNLLEKAVALNPKEDVAVIQYTGGTTGDIKGAMLTHYNLIANVYQSYVLYRQKVKFGEETVLTVTPLYHVYAMTSAMNLGIYLGARLLIIQKFQTDRVLEQIKRHRPTMFPGVPKMYVSFLNHPKGDSSGLDSLKVCSSGSAPLPIEIIHRFKEMTGVTILEGFGMSETSPTTHRTPINGEHKAGSIGIPVPETNCRIVDNESNILEPNQVGELLIKGPQVMKGYWNNPVETKNTLKDGWFYTGDLAVMDKDGYFYIVGRKKEMIIFGGFNVYPQEVEGVLYSHPQIQEAAVVGLPDEVNGEIAKAYIVPKEDCELNLDEIRAFCYTKLTPYKVPRLFEVKESLPRNGVGKLLKRTLIQEEKEKRGFYREKNEYS